ncbi:MAG: hypothetical protein P0S95_07755 [Rhabdochlamydiaceae bacterium]|nr:hypothetical protein [Candidatus Amphrikana amoebophyrae]
MKIQINHVLFIAILGVMSGCSIYKNGFQCPAGKGIGCASVGEVLDLIVEKEEGEDLFIANRDIAKLRQYKEKEKKHRKKQNYDAPDVVLELVKNEFGELVLIQVEEEQSYGDS